MYAMPKLISYHVKQHTPAIYLNLETQFSDFVMTTCISNVHVR